MAQNTSTAVMARRAEAPDSLDFFPTPPWATRALFVDGRHHAQARTPEGVNQEHGAAAG